MSLLQTMLTHLDSPECEPSEQVPPPAMLNTTAKSIAVSSRSILHGFVPACWQLNQHSKQGNFQKQRGKA